MTTIARNTICNWYDGRAEEMARFFAAMFPGNWGQTPISLGFNDVPVLVGHGELEHGLGKIDRNGSSIHVGLLTFDEDLIPTPMKASAPISRKQTGESIPSIEPTAASALRALAASAHVER